jgi:hypothetical protein
MHKLVTFAITSWALGFGITAQAQHQGSTLPGLIQHQEYSSPGFFRPSLSTKCSSAVVSGTGEVSGQYAGHSFRMYRDANGTVAMEIDGKTSRAFVGASGHVEKLVDAEGNAVKPAQLPAEQVKSLVAKTRGEFIAALKECGFVAPQTKCLAGSTFSDPASKSCIDDGSEFLDESYWSSMFEGQFDEWFNENQWDWLTQEQCAARKESCALACDANLGLTGVACAAFAVASGPGGVLCAAVGLAAWASCRSRCNAMC